MLAAPVGRLNAEGASRFWEIVSSRVSKASPSLLIDMTGVDWMSSAGIGILGRREEPLREATEAMRSGGGKAAWDSATPPHRAARALFSSSGAT